jgi:hypothetical protein
MKDRKQLREEALVLLADAEDMCGEGSEARPIVMALAAVAYAILATGDASNSPHNSSWSHINGPSDG